MKDLNIFVFDAVSVSDSYTEKKEELVILNESPFMVLFEDVVTRMLKASRTCLARLPGEVRINSYTKATTLGF